MKEYTIEEINAYRAEVYRILIGKGETEDFARGVCNYDGITIRGSINEPDKEGNNEDIITIWGNDIMPFNTPKDYADLMTL